MYIELDYGAQVVSMFEKFRKCEKCLGIIHQLCPDSTLHEAFEVTVIQIWLEYFVCISDL